MPIVQLWALEGKKLVMTGTCTYNCIARQMPLKETYLTPVKNYKIVQLINGDQLYIDNKDFNKVKEYFNEGLC